MRKIRAPLFVMSHMRSYSSLLSHVFDKILHNYAMSPGAE
jgi:hypothetical protein